MPIMQRNQQRGGLTLKVPELSRYRATPKLSKTNQVKRKITLELVSLWSKTFHHLATAQGER